MDHWFESRSSHKSINFYPLFQIVLGLPLFIYLNMFRIFAESYFAKCLIPYFILFSQFNLNSRTDEDLYIYKFKKNEILMIGFETVYS